MKIYTQSFVLGCNLMYQMTSKGRLESQSVARVALLNCLFVSGRLQNYSEQGFGMRGVILCPESWANVTQRSECEWREEVCVSNTA